MHWVRILLALGHSSTKGGALEGKMEEFEASRHLIDPQEEGDASRQGIVWW
jgi:hypothetical protein